MRRTSLALGAVAAGGSDFDVAVLNASTGTRATLPAGTNTTDDEIHPTISRLTPDERYLAFVRHVRGSHRTLFVWDSQTQTLLNPVGLDLGSVDNHDVGSVSLFLHPLIKASQLGPGGLLGVNLTGPSGTPSRRGATASAGT